MLPSVKTMMLYLPCTFPTSANHGCRGHSCGVVGLSGSDKSEIRNLKLVYPLAVSRSEDRQLLHHELRFADGANHMRAGGAVPFFRHAFAGVAPPALNERAVRENVSVDPVEFRFV